MPQNCLPLFGAAYDSLDTVNALKFLTLFLFYSQMKWRLSRMEFAKYSVCQNGKQIRLLLQKQYSCTLDKDI